MRPIAIAAELALWRRRRLAGIAFEPRSHIVVVTLLGPQHARKRLTHDQVRVFRPLLRKPARIKLVRLRSPQIKHLFELGFEWIRRSRFGLDVREAQPERRGASRRDSRAVVRGAFRARLRRIYGFLRAMHEIVVET